MGASADATWAFVLAKGLLLLSPWGSGDSHAVVLPEKLEQLQRTVLDAVLGLASPVVAFAETMDSEASIVTRSLELAQHRSELAMAAVACQVAELVLVSASTCCGDHAGHKLASFLASLLQADLEHECQLESVVDLGQTVKQSRNATAEFLDRLRPYEGLLWYYLASVPASAEIGISNSFIQ